jgi:hypothetical protein
MSALGDIGALVQDPSLLIDLCREVVNRLDDGQDQAETAAMETQLREIAKAVARLDRLGVPVPEALRGEKTRLAAALGGPTQTTLALSHLADQMTQDGVLRTDSPRGVWELTEPSTETRPA